MSRRWPVVAEVVAALVAALSASAVVLCWVPAVGGRLRARPSGSVGAVPIARRRQLVTSGLVGMAVGVAALGAGLWALVVACVVALVSYLVLGQLRSSAETRLNDRLTADLPGVCDLLVVCLDAGLPLRGAAGVIAEELDSPLADRLAEVAAKVGLGVDDQRAWAEFASEPALAVLGRELARATGTGVALSSRLRAVGLDARREAFARAEGRARKAGVSSVLPLMVCFLPAFLLLGVLPMVGGLALHALGQ